MTDSCTRSMLRRRSLCNVYLTAAASKWKCKQDGRGRAKHMVHVSFFGVATDTSFPPDRVTHRDTTAQGCSLHCENCGLEKLRSELDLSVVRTCSGGIPTLGANSTGRRSNRWRAAMCSESSTATDESYPSVARDPSSISRCGTWIQLGNETSCSRDPNDSHANTREPFLKCSMLLCTRKKNSARKVFFVRVDLNAGSHLCTGWRARSDPLAPLLGSEWALWQFGSESTKNACCLRRVSFTNLLLAQGKVHITKMHFYSNWASLILKMYDLREAQKKKKLRPKGPFKDFLGS